MPVDEQTTRTGRHDPKSPHEATPEATQGEFGVPPTVKQSTKPTARAPISSPPPSLAHKIDASSSKTRPQAADDLEPAILTNRTGGQALIAKQRRDAVSISVADSAKRILNSLSTLRMYLPSPTLHWSSGSGKTTLSDTKKLDQLFRFSLHLRWLN